MQQDENDYKQNVKDSNTFREETGGSQGPSRNFSACGCVQLAIPSSRSDSLLDNFKETTRVAQNHAVCSSFDKLRMLGSAMPRHSRRIKAQLRTRARFLPAKDAG
jgi:hypothetical protein